MIIPSANVECSTLICSLHSLALKYRYGAYRRRRFPSLLEFHIKKDHYYIPTIIKDVRKEKKAIKNIISFGEYRLNEYKDTIDDFIIFMEKNYSQEYPEIMI